MIYVIDNGERYSDHSVYFVESDMAPSEVDEMLKLTDSNYHLIFMADVLEWREPSARVSVFRCYFGSDAFDYAITHESETLLREEAALEVEERKKSPTRRMFATDELARRAARGGGR